MLYIKFKIQDASKFEDFEKLYQHMVNVREPGFQFEEEPTPNFDWDNMTDKEMQATIEALLDSGDQNIIDAKRYKKLIPNYAHDYLENYQEYDNDKLGQLGILDTKSILNYLEYGFEVFFTKLEQQNNNLGLIEFDTDNYPFGGLERFIMVLGAFNLTPVECFNGFSIQEFEWRSPFEYTSIDLPEKTKIYLKEIENRQT